MKIRSLTRLAGFGLLTLGLACSGPAADRPTPADSSKGVAMFGGGPSRNLVNTTDKNIPDTWNVKPGKQKNIKWVAELGSTSYGGPVISGGKVFVGTNNEKPRNPKAAGDLGVVMCFNAADGKFLWQSVHDKLDNVNENDWPREGIASSPAVEGNRLWYVSNRCELICADTEGFHDGKNDGVGDEKYKEKTDADIVWRLDMMSALGVYPHFLANCSPLVAGDLVFVVTSNGVDGDFKLPAPEAPSFLAVEKKTGKVKWKDSSPGKNVMAGQWASPAYAVVKGKGQVLFPGGDGWLYGFEAETGKLLWKFDGNPKAATFKPGGRGEKNYFVATPVIHDNMIYIGTGQNPDDGADVGHFWCIDLVKATEKGATNKNNDVSPVGDNFDATAAVNKDSALVWHLGGKNPAGTERDYHFGRTISTAAVHDGLVYVPEVAGFMYCIDAKTGKIVWDYDLKAGTWASPYFVDGKVYLGTDNRSISIFKAGRAGPPKDSIPEVDVDNLVKGPVTVSDGVLYVMTYSHLYAIASK